MTLLDRIEKLREREDFIEEIQDTDVWLDLVSNRRAEILSEMPVPFCCPLIAGARVVYPISDASDYKDPHWRSQYPVPGNGYASVEVHACPFCSTKLPALVLKKDPPPVVCQSDDYYCGTCDERLQNCLCSHPLSVYEVENAPPVFAVTALITQVLISPRLFLSVSRKNDPEDKGLPGGKIDPGETALHALIREVKEETGLTVIDCHPVFDAQDSTGKRCVTYEVTKLSGEVATKEAGVVEWVDQEALLKGVTFEIYNRALLHHIDPHKFRY